MSLFSRDDPQKEKPRKLNWKDYWEARWQWSAAGSIHSQYKEDLKNIPNIRELKNKFIALCIKEDVGMEYYTKRKPEIHAWASVKYEWGKMRAIYGTDITSYILTNFVFFNCEDTLTIDFPVGKKARPSFVTARVGAVLENTIPLCLDYEDFNSQHSNEAMEAVLNAWVKCNEKNLSDDQIKAAPWVIDSIRNTIITDNMGTNTTYKSKGTLMSGWRLTTFVNSVLNYIYTNKILGQRTTTFRSIHNGDDVLIGTRNFEIARIAIKSAEKNNIRLQRKKCAYGGIAEFLRVDHIRGDTGQYLARNIATLMHSRIESKIAVQATDIIEAMEERLKEYVQRGGIENITIKLREKYYKRLSPTYNMTSEDFYDIKILHRVVGGINSEEYAPINKIVLTNKIEKPTEMPEKMPGVNAYANAVKRTLDLDVDIGMIVKRVYNATVKAVQMTRIRQTVVENSDERRYRLWRALYKAHSDVAEMPLFGKAMLTGFVFDVLAKSSQLDTLRRILSVSRDKLTLLRIIV